MTSFVALDGVKSFLRLKDVTNTCKRMRRGLSIGGRSSVQRRKVGRAEDFKCVFVVYCAIKSKCVICCFLGNYDRIISDALEKQNRNGQKHKESNFSN